jgi:nucleoside-diphosphate-sugar epimerase
MALLHLLTNGNTAVTENSEVFRLWGDNTLIKELTGFQPDFDIKTGLTETCNWFANPENLKKYKANIYNI